MSFPQSLFIPNAWHLNEEMIKNQFAMSRIGLVSSVVFKTKRSKKSAVVHFIEKGVRANVFEYNENFWSNIVMGKQEYIQVSYNRFVKCLKYNEMKNKSQGLISLEKNLPSSSMRTLEEVILKQQRLIEEQGQAIEKLTSKLEDVKQVTYFLTGGLFCQKTQGNTLDMLLNSLFHDRDQNKLETTSNWGHWPTTRQGDDCERRLDALEQLIHKNSEEDIEVEKEIQRRREWEEEDRYNENQELANQDRIETMDW